MENGGSKRVEITGLSDKKQITAVFAGALSGAFLKPQVIYNGTTDKSHPQIRESLVRGGISHIPLITGITARHVSGGYYF